MVVASASQPIHLLGIREASKQSVCEAIRKRPRLIPSACRKPFVSSCPTPRLARLSEGSLGDLWPKCP
eukprot:12513928-Heterocapsa_arctica.AAC.1